MAHNSGMKLLPLAIPLVLLAGCAQQQQVQPAIESAEILREAFVNEQTNVRAFVQSGNPPAGQMARFVAAQEEARLQFLRVYETHIRHLMSLGAFNPEDAERILTKIAEYVEAR